MARTSLSESWLFPFLLHLLVIGALFGYIYSQRYFRCLYFNPLLCVQSQKYVSADRSFLFRYPKDYALSTRTGSELVTDFGFEDGVTWINFSHDFSIDEGGDRLGKIIVSKNLSYVTLDDYIQGTLGTYTYEPVYDMVTIAGEPAVCTSKYSGVYSVSAPSFHCAILHDQKMYEIFFDYDAYYHKQPLSYYKQQRALILSTFTFL